MAKVITSQGMQEFVASGKHEVIPNHKPAEPARAATAESKPAEGDKTATETAEKVQETPAKEPEVENDGLEDGDKDFPERVRKRIAKKHRELMEARESAAADERLAEQQYNERRLADQRAERAEARVRELEAKGTAPEAKPELAEPVETDPKYVKDGQFDWKAYSKDVAKFEAAQAVADERKKQVEERQAQERTQAETRVIESAAAARKVHPDFDQVMSAVKDTEADQVPQYVLNYLMESPNAGRVAYHLAKNPEDSARIAKLKPILGLAELGKLEDRLMTPPAAAAKAQTPVGAERGTAPAPITPLNGEGSSGVVTDPAKMDFKQLRAYRRAQARDRH